MDNDDNEKIIKLADYRDEQYGEVIEWEEMVEMALDSVSLTVDHHKAYLDNSVDELIEVINKQTIRIDMLEDRLDKQARILERISEVLKGTRHKL